jgi:hypothetical protein
MAVPVAVSTAENVNKGRPLSNNSNLVTCKACVTNPPIPSSARLRCTCGVFLGNFGEWPYGATTAAVLQQFLFSRRRGAV